jgi:predicted Rossmann fold flavoprotein
MTTQIAAEASASLSERRFDVVVVGAGAAGLMCAIEAGRRGRRTLLLDHADRVGKKILISGGGRSNFTNLHCTHENFLSENRNFARSALARFTPQDMIALVEAHGISYHEKTLGQLFCDRSARDLVALLERECESAHVRTELNTRILSVTANDTQGRRTFSIETSSGNLRCESVVVATGGLSIPKIGATGWGYDLARQFGLRVVEPRPALVPLTLDSQDKLRWCDLAGVSAEINASVQEPATLRRTRSQSPQFRERMLITHRGLSGPSILQISSFWKPGESIVLDLAPGLKVFAALRSGSGDRNAVAVQAALRPVLPTRLAERWIREASMDGLIGSGSDALGNAALDALEDRLHAWVVQPDGSEGFAKAEVTAGGVDTAALSAQTLEARNAPGLYFIGEVVDVTGWLGGYNFQWAWASGFCSGQVA